MVDCEKSLKAKKLTLNSNLLEEFIWINGDPNRLTHAFPNILDNAIKFSYPNSKVTVLVALKGNLVMVTIADIGIGIESETLAHIFTSFSQENRKLAGTQGLGLGFTTSQRHRRTARG